MADILSESDIYTLVQGDESATNENLNAYSTSFRTVVENNWQHIHTSLTTGAELFCSQFQFRLGLGVLGDIRDFWPALLSHQPLLLSFVRGVLWHFFCQRQQPFYINFSPSYAINLLDGNGAEGGDTFFVYSSRSNFACLEQSFLIHDAATWGDFCSKILAQFSLEQYIKEKMEILNRKYPTGIVLPTALTFHVTKCVNRIYGARQQYLNKGLSSSCCENVLQTAKGTDCLWKALSSIVDVAKNGKIEKRPKKIRHGRCNKRVARRLRTAFTKWHRKTFPNSLVMPVCRDGFDSLAFTALEQFLGMNVMVYRCKLVEGKRVYGSTLRPINSRNKVFSVEFHGSNNHPETVDLLSSGKGHIQTIVDSRQFSSKYHCETCLLSFPRYDKLQRHSCPSSAKFKGNALVPWEIQLQRRIKEELPDSLQLQLKKEVIMITIIVEGHDFKVKVQWNDEAKIRTLIETFASVEQIALYLLDFLPQCVNKKLAQNLAMNVQFLAAFEKLLHDAAEKAFNASFSKDVSVLHHNSLIRIKQGVMDKLCKFRVYVQCGCEKVTLLDELFAIILSKFCNGNGKASVRMNQGKVNILTKEKYPIEFFGLNYFSPVFMRNQSDLFTFEGLLDLMSLFEKELSVDFLQITTPSGLGRAILSQGMTKRDLLSIYSPPNDLYCKLQNAVRFGVLAADKSIIHEEEGHFKSCLSFDVSKFYNFVLQQAKLYTGKCIIYERSESGHFICRPNRSRSTYANLIFLLLDEILEGQIYCSIFGVELRFRFPVDAVLFLNGEEIILGHSGCLFHPHYVGTRVACHENRQNITSAHKQKCETCQNEVKYFNDPLRPRLFRFKPGEHADSPHPLKKPLTYRQVYHESERNRKLVEEGSGGRRFVELRECEILRFFDAPLSLFAQHFDLPLKSEFSQVKLGEKLREVCATHFPLMRRSGKLKENDLVDGIKTGAINGFVVVTGEVGVQGQGNLGILKPFSFYGATTESGSFSIQEQVLTTDYLRWLLNSPFIPDFKITEILKLYEYKKPNRALFAALSDHLMATMVKNEDNQTFVSLLKVAINSSVGFMNKKNRNFHRNIICDKADYFSMAQLRNFITSISINDDFSLLSFKNFSPDLNASHLNYQIILDGKRFIIEFILKMQTYLQLECKRTNTDGFTTVSVLSLPEVNEEAISKATILDHYLKEDLTEKQLTEYVQFKQQHFVSLGVCERHFEHYFDCLRTRDPFVALACCRIAINKPKGFVMKIEIGCDKGIILHANRLALFNTKLKREQIKSSGGHCEKLFEVADMCYKDMTNMML